MTTPAAAPAAVVVMDPPATPAEQVDLKLGDKSFKVDKAIADTVNAAIAAAADGTAAAKDEVIADLTKKLQDATKPAPRTDAADPDGDYNKLFVDPKGFLQQFKADIVAEMTGAYTANEAQKEFWQEFYRVRPELQGHDFFVKSVMTRDFDALKTLKVPAAISKLGDAVTAELIRLNGGKPLPKNDKQRPAAEGGTHKAGGESKEGKDGSEHSLPDSEQPQTLTSILRERREARRSGRSKAAAA